MRTAMRAASVPRFNFPARQRLRAWASFSRSKTSWMTGMTVAERDRAGRGDGLGDQAGVLGLPLDDDAQRDDGGERAALGDLLDHEGNLERARDFVIAGFPHPG
jgi:hypothetical protein